MNKTFKNVISLGYQCYTSQSLKCLNLRDCSFPFDYLRSPLPQLYEILSSLRYNSFSKENLQNLLKIDKTGFTVNEKEFYNRFYFGHFIPVNNNSEIFLASDEILDTFKRRFDRLRECFFTENNLLIYNDLGVPKSYRENWLNDILNISKLNINNKIFCILHENEKINLLSEDSNILYVTINLQDVCHGNHAERSKLNGLHKQAVFDSIKKFIETDTTTV